MIEKKDEVIVYWAPFKVYSNVDNYFGFKEFEPVIKEIKQLGNILSDGGPKNNASEFLKCPSVLSNVKNVFSFSSPINLKIERKKGTVSTLNRNQEFFDNVINIRNVNTGFISVAAFGILLFTEETSLIAKQKTAVYTSNDFTEKTGIIEGQFDIGQWFRPWELAFYIKKEEVVNINEDDILYYLEFLTEKKIIFKKFYCTESLAELSNFCVRLKESRQFSIKTYLQDCYNLFTKSKLKKQILREIKSNILD